MIHSWHWICLQIRWSWRMMKLTTYATTSCVVGIWALALKLYSPQSQITTYQHQYSEKKMQDLSSNDQTLKLFYLSTQVLVALLTVQNTLHFVMLPRSRPEQSAEHQEIMKQTCQLIRFICPIGIALIFVLPWIDANNIIVLMCWPWLSATNLLQFADFSLGWYLKKI